METLNSACEAANSAWTVYTETATGQSVRSMVQAWKRHAMPAMMAA